MCSHIHRDFYISVCVYVSHIQKIFIFIRMNFWVYHSSILLQFSCYLPIFFSSFSWRFFHMSLTYLLKWCICCCCCCRCYCLPFICDLKCFWHRWQSLNSARNVGGNIEWKKCKKKLKGLLRENVTLFPQEKKQIAKCKENFFFCRIWNLTIWLKIFTCNQPHERK